MRINHFEIMFLLSTVTPRLVSSQYVWSNHKVSFLPADLLKTEDGYGYARGSRKDKCTTTPVGTKQSSSLLWAAALLSACAVLVLVSSACQRQRWSPSGEACSAEVKAKASSMKVVGEPAAKVEDAQSLQAAEADEAEWLQAADAELVRSGQGWFVRWRRRLEAAETALTMRDAELAAERAAAVVEAAVAAAVKDELVTATAVAETEAAEAELRLEEAELALAAREVAHTVELKAKQAFVEAAEEAIAATSAGAESSVDEVRSLTQTPSSYSACCPRRLSALLSPPAPASRPCTLAQAPHVPPLTHLG